MLECYQRSRDSSYYINSHSPIRLIQDYNLVSTRGQCDLFLSKPLYSTANHIDT